MDILLLLSGVAIFMFIMWKLDELEDRIIVLEQGYPNEEELKKLKVGGTD